MSNRRVEKYAWKRVVDESGRGQAVWYDPSARDRWVSMEMVDGRVPDFSDPTTWAALRSRAREHRARTRGSDSGYRSE